MASPAVPQCAWLCTSQAVRVLYLVARVPYRAVRVPIPGSPSPVPGSPASVPGCPSPVPGRPSSVHRPGFRTGVPEFRTPARLPYRGARVPYTGPAEFRTPGSSSVRRPGFRTGQAEFRTPGPSSVHPARVPYCTEGVRHCTELYGNRLDSFLAQAAKIPPDITLPHFTHTTNCTHTTYTHVPCSHLLLSTTQTTLALSLAFAHLFHKEKLLMHVAFILTPAPNHAHCCTTQLLYVNMQHTQSLAHHTTKLNTNNKPCTSLASPVANRQPALHWCPTPSKPISMSKHPTSQPKANAQASNCAHGGLGSTKSLPPSKEEGVTSPHYPPPPAGTSPPPPPPPPPPRRPPPPYGQPCLGFHPPLGLAFWHHEGLCCNMARPKKNGPQ